jgi:hypothetical protein
MKRYNFIIIGLFLIALSSCTKTVSKKPTNSNSTVNPTTNFVSLTDAGTFYDINPACTFLNIVSDGSNTSVLTLSVNAGSTGTFALNLTVYSGDTSGVGDFKEYNSLKDIESVTEFTTDGHGNTTNVYDYIVDTAIVTVTSHDRNQLPFRDIVTGTFELKLQPSSRLVTGRYKTVTGSFNTLYGTTVYQ